MTTGACAHRDIIHGTRLPCDRVQRQAPRLVVGVALQHPATATKRHLHHWHLGNQACMRHAACMVTGQVAQRLMPWESCPPRACGVATAGACLHRMLRMQAPVQHYGHNTQQEWHAWRSSTRRTAVPDRHRHRHLLQEAQALAPSTQVSPVSVQSERPRRRTRPGGRPHTRPAWPPAARSASRRPAPRPAWRSRSPARRSATARAPTALRSAATTQGL